MSRRLPNAAREQRKVSRGSKFRVSGQHSEAQRFAAPRRRLNVLRARFKVSRGRFNAVNKAQRFACAAQGFAMATRANTLDSRNAKGSRKRSRQRAATFRVVGSTFRVRGPRVYPSKCMVFTLGGSSKLRDSGQQTRIHETLDLGFCWL